MKTATTPALKWLWPHVGPTPVTFGMDAEIFDSDQFPNAQTFVREAIQNSLDARVCRSTPVEVHFDFHKRLLGDRRKFLEDLQEKKALGLLSWPKEWENNSIEWLTVQDFNSSGLLGDVGSRISDFWNYWLNFGVSNKSGAGRGGRGIGRVTFLIASRINTVIGLTRRNEDHRLLACGMSVLKPVEVDGELKTSYAYLAKDTDGNIFELYDGEDFHMELADAFEITEHMQERQTGLSLAIPYPHQDQTPAKLTAAAIENFAPAIANGYLVVSVDGRPIDAKSIDSEAERVQQLFVSPAMQENPVRLLELIRRANNTPDYSILIETPKRFTSEIDEDSKAHLRELWEKQGSISFQIDVPVIRNGRTSYSPISASLAKAAADSKAIDMFYREGMALPLVTARNTSNIDLVVQSNEGELATYLNFCEGKAHLDLLENRDVKEKLRERGFAGVGLKRFVKWLMDDIRAVVLPDAAEPDSSVMRDFFSVTRKDDAAERPGPGGREGGEPNRPKLRPDEPVPPPRLQPFDIVPLADGFRITANPKFEAFPVGLRAEVAYATGERRPKWSKHDFELEKLCVTGSKTHVSISGNKIDASSCDKSFVVEVTGFDGRREIAVNLFSVEEDDA